MNDHASGSPGSAEVNGDAARYHPDVAPFATLRPGLGGRLVQMAGERMRTPGWTEVSAVCTDPAYRGQGLATRLIRAVAAGIGDRGETPFLHALASNTSA
jgi:predicted GNAT family acetyltransferase